MSSLLVRNLDPKLIEALKLRGESNARSMEAEVRVILATAVHEQNARFGVGSRIRELFVGLDGPETHRASDTPRAADFGA